ncbi:hypothetical protein QR680_001998 [Steinernema hermaphroditum]|uniref:EF-hand domain-containing protein n=1 Tax=Steinernema hermaphroditum TaxID=289476 RepID=A0AA39H0T5_9BILA|nr:hypothetical protein QR680_001998 [Steinernema hermaphroditum]
MVADVVRWSLLVILLAGPCVAPPPKRPQAEEQQKNDEHVQQQQQAEQQKPLYEFTYSRYLEQVVKVLESDPKFAERLKQMPEADIKSGKIADHIDDLGPDVFEQLTKAKLGEIERLRETITKQIEKDGGAHNVKVPEHLDVNNWEKFGKEDLRKLIVKTVSDMDEIDRQRRDEFKEYEMKKKAEEDHRLAQMTPEERKKAEEEINAQKQRHNDHEKLKHPGSRDQLEEVWEESDNMDKDTFDPRTFFNLHDLNGDGFWSAEELEALFQLELEKVYNETNPDDDPRERIEEMYRMREHVVQQMDKNNDRMISLDEFLQDTEAQTPNKDDGWNDIAKEQIYTDEELRKFEEEYAKNQANAQHQVPPAGQVPVQQQPVVQQAVPVAQHQQVPVAQQHPAAQQPPQPVPVAHQMPQQQQGGHAQPVPVQQQHAQAAQRQQQQQQQQQQINRNTVDRTYGVNLDGKLMKKEEQKHVRVYKGDRLEDIFFGSSDSESSDDSAYRCRINTDRLKTKPVPLTRRQARSQKTSRPSEAALERRRKSDALDMHSNDESVAEPANDKPSSSRKKPRLASRDENQSERSQKDIAIARIDKKAEKTMIVPQRAEEQNLEPDIDSDIARMRDAILLYNYMSLPGGNTLSTTRPVYRPYLKRTLRYIWNGNARKRSLNEVIAQLHHRLNPEDALFPITSRRIDGVDTLDFKRGNKDENEQNSFTLMFYGIRNRNLAGNREATVDLYLAKDVDGEFQELKHLESRTFTMAVNKNKDVNSIAVSLKEEFSLRLPKGVSKMSYYLVLRVSFSEDPMISSGGRSLRKIPVRQSAMHLNSKELRLTLTPTKTKGDPDELVMFGACLITSISESGHTLPKTSTRNGIVLLETHKISWNAAHWTTDPQLVSRMLKLAKKLHMNPFVLAEFVEDEDIVEEVSDTSIKGEKDASKELISDCNAMEEDGIPAEAEHVQFEFPEKLAYRFNALPNTKCPPLQNAFKNGKREEHPKDESENLPKDDYRSVPLTEIADILETSGRGKISFAKSLSDEKTTKGNTLKRYKARHSDVIIFGQKGNAFPQPDSTKVVTRIVQPPNRCIFCKQHFPDLFALILHMRTGYPRLDFIYRGRLNDTVACIDVLLNEHFNGDKDTQGLEYSCDVIKKLPATAPIYLVSRFERHDAKTLVKSLEPFKTPSRKDKRLYARSLPISFNPITLHPYYEVPLNTTKKKLDQDWRIECMLRRLHEFTDLTDEEKDFMGLWNMFCLNLENRPTGRNSFYAACRRFLRTYNEQLTEQALQFEWFSHVAYFKGRGFIDEDEAYDLIARCDNPDYSPEEDDLHFVSRDRQRRQDEAEERRKKLEEAGSKRLKESNSSSGGQKDRKDFRHLLPMMSTRTAIKRAFPGSRDSSVLEREESSSVDSSFAGKRNSRHSKEPDYSHYLRDY